MNDAKKEDDVNVTFDLDEVLDLVLDALGNPEVREAVLPGAMQGKDLSVKFSFDDRGGDIDGVTVIITPPGPRRAPTNA